ncbi:MAG: hypothetical protein RSD14_03405 [Clostridia bacterium]
MDLLLDMEKRLLRYISKNKTLIVVAEIMFGFRKGSFRSKYGFSNFNFVKFSKENDLNGIKLNIPLESISFNDETIFCGEDNTKKNKSLSIWKDNYEKFSKQYGNGEGLNIAIIDTNKNIDEKDLMVQSKVDYYDTEESGGCYKQELEARLFSQTAGFLKDAKFWIYNVPKIDDGTYGEQVASVLNVVIDDVNNYGMDFDIIVCNLPYTSTSTKSVWEKYQKNNLKIVGSSKKDITYIDRYMYQENFTEYYNNVIDSNFIVLKQIFDKKIDKQRYLERIFPNIKNKKLDSLVDTNFKCFCLKLEELRLIENKGKIALPVLDSWYYNDDHYIHIGGIQDNIPGLAYVIAIYGIFKLKNKKSDFKDFLKIADETSFKKGKFLKVIDTQKIIKP